jgi:hypothetical protein
LASFRLAAGTFAGTFWPPLDGMLYP